jgi:hypothetical protein
MHKRFNAKLMKLFSLSPRHRISEAFTHRNLALFLIQPPASRRGAAAASERPFLTLDEALQGGHARLHETGRVGELEVENLTDIDLYAQAGDVVKGGWQDRALGADFIVPHRTRPRRMRLRTYCVERQRWQQRASEASNLFRSAEHLAPSRELKLSIRHDCSQASVWSSVDAAQEKLSRNLGADVRAALSPSSLPLTLEHDAVRRRMAEYFVALGGLPECAPDAVGLAFAINGQLSSADLYASPELFRKLWPKLLEAAAFEALVEADAPGLTCSTPTPDEVSDWLRRARRGKKTTHEVTSRVKLVVRRNAGQVSFETMDAEQSNLCVHQTILAQR